jgi:hypothetical protein
VGFGWNNHNAESIRFCPAILFESRPTRYRVVVLTSLPSGHPFVSNTLMEHHPVFSIPAVVFLLLGAFFRGFSHTRRDTGIVLLSASALSALAMLSFFCAWASPDMAGIFPQRHFISLATQAIRAWTTLKALDVPKDYRSWKKFRSSKAKQ